MSEDAKHLITLMLAIDPEDRPPAAKLLSHRWLSDAPCAPGTAPAAALGAHVLNR